MSKSKDESRERRRMAFEERLERDAKERDRKATLTMWERIEEADASADVKEILHMLAEKLGLEG